MDNTDHKLLQRIYHTTQPITDDLTVIAKTTPVVYKDMDDRQIAQYVIGYLTSECEDIVYPAKSFAVAVIYAKLLHLYFGIGTHYSLNDPDLLFGNDPHFVVMEDALDIYTWIFEHMDRYCISIPNDQPQVKTTCEYFMQEFMIGSEEYFTIRPDMKKSPLFR